MFIELQNLGESLAFNSKEHLMYMNIYIYIYIYMIGSTINNNVIPLHSVSWVISPIFRWLLQLF